MNDDRDLEKAPAGLRRLTATSVHTARRRINGSSYV